MDTRDNIKHVVVVGGGINGLVAAYELVRWGLDVTIVERQGTLGGQASAIGYGDWHADVAFHRFSLGDYKIQMLASELDLGEIFEYPSARNALYLNGKSFVFGRPVDCLGIECLPFMVRIHLAIQMLRTRLWPMPFDQMDDMKALSWIHETSNADVYNHFWQPYLKARFGSDLKKVSAAWVCRKLLSFGENTDSTGRQNVVCFREGFDPVLKRLKEKITEFGGKFRMLSSVTEVVADNDQITAVKIKKGDAVEELECDALFLAVPLPVCAKILNGAIPDSHVEKMGHIDYLGNITVMLETAGPITDSYLTHVADEKYPFSLIVEHTNLVSPKNFEGKHLVYLSVYPQPNAAIFDESDAVIAAKAKTMLSDMFPGKMEDLEIENISVYKERYVHPLPCVGMKSQQDECRVPLGNVVIGSMGQSVPEEAGVEVAIREAQKNSAHLISVLKKELA